MASSEISICSNALVQLGDAPIASFGENTDRARTCANVWPQVRDMLLRKPWSYTRARVVLAPEATAPAFDWGYSFLLPADCMRVLQVGERGERINFEREGRRILSDEATLKIVYQRRIEDPAQWDASMSDAACAEMIARLAYPITQSTSLAQLKRQEADKAMREALAQSGQDNPPEDWADSPFVDVRY